MKRAIVGQKVTAKSSIDSFELYSILQNVRKGFSILKDWKMTISYANIDTYAKVNAYTYSSFFLVFLPYRRGHTARILIDSKLRNHMTRNACIGLISHELMHCEFIHRDINDDEEIIAEELLRRGYLPSVNALFFCICPTPCFGLIRKNIGGMDCKLYCPYKCMVPYWASYHNIP